MEMITSATIFKAFDGTIFVSETQCEEYEQKRKKLLSYVKFFEVKHTPDLTDTGEFTKGTLLAVYSENYLHREIATNYCINRFGLLGPSVFGYRIQSYFSLNMIDLDDFNKSTIEIGRFQFEEVEKILISHKEIDEFKDIERFINYLLKVY